jgi:uncharacterized protein YcfL
MKKFFAISILAVLLASCSDDEQPALVTNNNDYYPNTKGTSWTYSSLFLDTKIAVTGRTKKISGNVYAQLKATFPDFSGFSLITYLRKEDGNYYYRGEGFNGDYLFLRDNVPVGTTWTAETITEDGITENDLEIVEVDGTYSVNSFTFNNVIVVKVTSYDNEDPEVSYAAYNYYAKGVGLVLTTDDSEFINLSVTAYTIK